MPTAINFLILWGDGINCENETAHAVESAGGVAHKIHVNELIENPQILKSMHALIIPGGFSFGDHLGSGQALALKLEGYLKDELKEFSNSKPIMGICNGFQTLVRLGLLPDQDFQRKCALVKNEGGHFIDQWVVMQKLESPCIWTKNLPEKFELPIRHGEGRFIFASQEVLKNMTLQGQIALKYQENVNGAQERVAGICDSKGLVFALMPHPEAAIYDWQTPQNNKNAVGLQFFKNAIEYSRSHL